MMNFNIPTATGYLFAARRAVIFWTHIVVWPLEIMFDRIEDELEALGHRVRDSEEDNG